MGEGAFALTFVLHRPGEAPGLSLACAVVPFQLLMMSISNAMSAVNLRRSIVLNMTFDRALIPVSSVLTETIAFGASIVLVVLMMGVYGVVPTAAVAWLPLVVVANVALAAGFAYPASLFGLWFRELRPFGISAVRTDVLPTGVDRLGRDVL